MVNTRGGYALIVGGFDAKGANSGSSEVWNPYDGKYDPQPGNREFPLYPHNFRPPTPSTHSPVRAGGRLRKTSTARLKSSTLVLGAVERQ